MSPGEAASTSEAGAEGATAEGWVLPALPAAGGKSSLEGSCGQHSSRLPHWLHYPVQVTEHPPHVNMG